MEERLRPSSVGCRGGGSPPPAAGWLVLLTKTGKRAAASRVRPPVQTLARQPLHLSSPQQHIPTHSHTAKRQPVDCCCCQLFSSLANGCQGASLSTFWRSFLSLPLSGSLCLTNNFIPDIQLRPVLGQCSWPDAAHSQWARNLLGWQEVGACEQRTHAANRAQAHANSALGWCAGVVDS